MKIKTIYKCSNCGYKNKQLKAVNMYGGHAELILFPELEHNCWDEVYSDEKNYDWLLSFTARTDKPATEDPSITYYG